MVKFFGGKKTIDENSSENQKIVLDMNNIPKHIAIIMDGNGRWAKARNLPRSMGHKAGVESIINIVKECDKIGVKYLACMLFQLKIGKDQKMK